MQDEGSQLLALLTDAKRGEMVVDFCAGAGGKTLALGAAMRNTGRLYAFDISGHRLDALKPRLARSGLSNVLPGADRARARRAHQAPGRQDRPRAGRCAVLGPGHAAPQPRPEVAPVAEGGAGTAASSRRPSWPARRGCSSPAAGWSTPPAACCAARTRTSPRPSQPHRPTTSRRCRCDELLAAAQVARRRRRWRAGRLPAPVAASARHRRLLCRGLATALSCAALRSAASCRCGTGVSGSPH